MEDKKTTTYHYYDENGNILYSKIRVEENGSKTFRFERTENGKTVNNLGDCRKILYHLHPVLHAIKNNLPIFLVEGEKDAETLLNQGVVAATTHITLFWDESFTELLKNSDVIILYDYDKTGLQRRDMLCAQLHGRVKRLRIIDLPGLEYREKHGLDITDWLEMGHAIPELKSLVAATQDYVPKPQDSALKRSSLRTVSVEELFALELPPRELMLAPFLPTQGLAMIVAKRGVGKTHIALGIAHAVASGSTFLNWTAPYPRKVLYIDGEMPAVLMQERLRMITSMNNKSTNDFLQILTPDLQEDILPDLATKEGRNAIGALIADTELIIIDNISCLFRSGSENESESWQEAQEWALGLRKGGTSVLFVHHAGKSGMQRGTSKREDILDAVIVLKHPDDYKAEEGARFEVIYDKARHFTGGDAQSFQVHLQCNDDGIYRWEISDDPKELLIREIASMRNKGLTLKQIMENKKLTKSQVETLLIKANAKNLLKP